MKPILFAAAALILPSAARPVMEKPNVVVVLLDDAGYGDFSHTGNPTIHTPNISRMVSGGANFPQFYAASPACTASRYALLTGRNPAQSGLGTWVLSPGAKKHIHAQELTLAEGLREQGYSTGFFGKWHLGEPNAANGNTPDSFPLAHGFDIWEGTNVSNDYETGSKLIRTNPGGTTPIPGYEVLAENVFTDAAIHDDLTRRYRDGAEQYIRDHKGNPFLLYIAPNMPHLPVHAGDAFKGKSLRGLYGDCIEEIDAMIGTLLATLESEGIAENTLVIVTSDNGPWIKYQNTANDPKYGEARLLVGSALPFRDGKGSTWEGGVREAGVWYWPGTIPAATVVSRPASTMDVLPTVFALAGQPLPKDRTLDGRDISPYLNPEKFRGEVPGFEFVYTGEGDNRVCAVRKGPWKLHLSISSQTGESYGFKASAEEPLLFNVEQDPSERINVAVDNAPIVADLMQSIARFKDSLAKGGTFWDGEK